MKLITSSLLSIIFCASSFAQSNLSVIERFGPDYHPAAVATRTQGEVVVEVAIDGKGNVIDAKRISGHPLLTQSSLQASLKWKFSPYKDMNLRTATLTFNYILSDLSEYISSSENQIEHRSDSLFFENFAVQTTHTTLIPRLLLLPRNGGIINTTSCPIHDIPMSMAIVEYTCDNANQYQNIPEMDEIDKWILNSDEYQDAEEESFPNAEADPYYRDCEKTSIEQREVRFCWKCRYVREEWVMKFRFKLTSSQ